MHPIIHPTSCQYVGLSRCPSQQSGCFQAGPQTASHFSPFPQEPGAPVSGWVGWNMTPSDSILGWARTTYRPFPSNPAILTASVASRRLCFARSVCTDRRDMKSDRCAGWGGGWVVVRVAEGRDSILLGAVRGDLKVSRNKGEF